MYDFLFKILEMTSPLGGGRPPFLQLRLLRARQLQVRRGNHREGVAKGTDAVPAGTQHQLVSVEYYLINLYRTLLA